MLIGGNRACSSIRKQIVNLFSRLSLPAFFMWQNIENLKTLLFKHKIDLKISRHIKLSMVSVAAALKMKKHTMPDLVSHQVNPFFVVKTHQKLSIEIDAC